MGAVERADPLQAPDDVGHLAAEETAVGVQLVDDDVLDAREQAPPARVVRQHAGVEHVRVRHHDVAALLDRGAAAGRRVAVVGVDLEVDRKAGLERAKLRELVLGEGLGREEIDGAALRVFEQPLENGQVVAERLAARGGCHHDEVLTLSDGGISLGLVGVELVDPPASQGCDELGTQVRRQWRIRCG